MSSAGSSNYTDASFSECGELDAVDDIHAEYLRFEVKNILFFFSTVQCNNYFGKIA